MSRSLEASTARGVRLTLAAIAALALLLSAAPGANAGTTLFTGSFQCDDGKPLAGARVEMWKWHETWAPKIWPNAQQTGATTADENGAWAFRVGGDEVNWFARVVLSSAEAEVRDWLFPWNWFADTPPNQNDVPTQDYGAQRVPGYQCRVWRGFRQAALDYQSDTGMRAPQGEVVVKAGAPNAGVPFAMYDEVHWPSNHAVVKKDGTSTAHHEFAHTFRHTMDGDLGHFLIDAGFYLYPRTHYSDSCDIVTNSGFAFNEGWAEYWAGQVMTPCAKAPNDHRIERNVSSALKRLQGHCGLTRGQMVAVLQNNPGRIHSYDDFQAASGCQPPLFGSPGNARDARVVTKAERIAALARARVSAAKRMVSVALKNVRALDKELSAARRRAPRRARPCPAPCTTVAERTIAPILVAGQRQQATAIVKALGPFKNAKAAAVLARKPAPRQLRELDAKGAAIQRASARIAAATFAAANRALKRIDVNGSTKPTRDALALARTRARSGDLQSLQALAPLPARYNRPKAAGPAPAASTVVDLREPSTTTINGACDGSGKWYPPTDGSATISGTLTPAAAGSTVTVTHHPDGIGGPEAPFTHVVQTDANGTWTDAVGWPEWGPGSYNQRWVVVASFAGDDNRRPSTSAACTLNDTLP